MNAAARKNNVSGLQNEVPQIAESMLVRALLHD